VGSLVVVATHCRFTYNEKLIKNNGYVAQLLKFRKFACGSNNKILVTLSLYKKCARHLSLSFKIQPEKFYDKIADFIYLHHNYYY
jgi:hypothetical protein